MGVPRQSGGGGGGGETVKGAVQCWPMCPTSPVTPDEAEPQPSAQHVGSEQEQLITKIRRRYNVEVVPGRSAEDEEAARELVQTIAGQAKLLSTELYTKPTHFLLELLQNADDCGYAAGVQPRVLLVLMPDALLHATNERGFTAADVKAICDMSKSTKSRKVGAFTGEKGIGFKATAVASEVTYISSSGYKFAFDMRPEAYDVPCLGLVCPRWEDSLDEWMQQGLAQRLDGTGLSPSILEGCTTRIWMSLRPDLDMQRLTQELHMLDPYMLLNLRKLRDVTVLMVQQEGAERSCHMKRLTRADADSTSVTISVEEGVPGTALAVSTHRLLCMRTVLQVPEMVAEVEEKREGVDQVEVVFALPTGPDGSAQPDPHAQVFSFLPVKPYGFRLHIQADFILPSSREGILENRPWNRWLAEQLGPAFVRQAMQAVTASHQQQLQEDNQPSTPDDEQQQQRSAQAHLSPTALLQYLPLPGDVTDGFMASVSTAIMQQLQQQPCVLTASGQLSRASTTLRPDPLLQQANGEPLISNDWLQQGLPGREFVHDDILAQPDRDRTAQVLLQLGSRQFDCLLLLCWLSAAGTARVLQELQPTARAVWLSELYSCCMRLKAQPGSSHMHLAADSHTTKLLAAAPILQLHGSQQLVSLQQLAASGRRVYLWDSSLGNEADLQLFSVAAASDSNSNSTGLAALCFVDPSTLGPDGATMLSAFLGISLVPLSVLVQHILQQQLQEVMDVSGLTDSTRDPLLVFLMRNNPRLSTQDLQALQQRLSLRCAAGHTGSSNMYRPAKLLHLPLRVSTLGVSPSTLSDPALQKDLSTAGVAFVCPAYEDLGKAGQLSSTQDVWQVLKSFGVQQLTLADAVQHLLKLYKSGCFSIVRWERHIHHLRFLTECAKDSVCLQHICLGLHLYEQQQDTAVESPAWQASRLCWPVIGPEGHSPMTDQLRVLCGVRFVHPCYVVPGAPGYDLVRQIAQRLSSRQVWQHLVDVHSTKDLQQCAADLEVSLQDMLLQQVEYLAGVRLELPSITPQHSFCFGSAVMPQKPLLLLSSTEQLIPSRQLHLPPADSETLKLLRELDEAGCGLHLLHPCFEPCWQEVSSEQHLLLTQILGVQHADEAAVIAALVKLHLQGSAAVEEAQRARHLAYVAQHIQVLQRQPALLKQVKDAVLLLDATGSYRKAAELHMALGSHFAALQSDMCAAGMRFLHSSYAAGGAPDTGRTFAARQLEALLAVLGVQQSDVNSVVRHVLKLYGSSAVRPSPEQHFNHLRFVQERWYDLDAAVQAKVPKELLLLSAEGTAPADVSSSSALWVYAPASGMYLQPAPSSIEFGLMETLQVHGGARFLHCVYSDKGVLTELMPFLQNHLGLKVLQHTDAARHLLAAHSDGCFQNTCSAAQLAAHALYMAQHADRDILKACKSKLLLAVSANQAGTKVLFMTASSGTPLFFPAEGEDWALQQVLPPDRVKYLHPAYVQLLAEIQDGEGCVHEATKLKHFLTIQLDVHVRPVVGSGSLKNAISRGECWEPLLLLLADEWLNYCSADRKKLADLLKHMQVATSSGFKPLQDCFFFTSQMCSSLLQVMQTLHVPILQLPDPDHHSWCFLKQCGVSMELQWPMLLKILQQQSSSGAVPEVQSMQQLYNSINALGQLDQRTALQVQAAFQQQPLIFVPGRPGKSGRSTWRRSSEVFWRPQAGHKALFPHMQFIEGAYKDSDLEGFFTRSLQIRNADVNDLRESLLHFARQPAKDVADSVRSVYELLARHAAELNWLPGFFEWDPVLLVQHRNELFFTSRSSSTTPIYLPDNTELLNVFSGDCTTLSVPLEKLPALQPLLDCIKPALPSLAGSVQRSCGATDSKKQKQLEPLWTKLLQQALPLFACLLYYRHNKLYMQLLEGRHLHQLQHMPVLKAPGLVRTLTLGHISKQIPTKAAAQVLSGQEAAKWQQQQHQQEEGKAVGGGDPACDTSYTQPVLLVDAAACSRPDKLLLNVADVYVDLLLLLAAGSGNANSSSSSMSEATAATPDLIKQLRSMLKDVFKGDMQGAQNELEYDGIGHIPAEYDPWRTPGGVTAAAADEDDSSCSDGSSEDAADDEDSCSISTSSLTSATPTAGVTSRARASDSYGSGNWKARRAHLQPAAEAVSAAGPSTAAAAAAAAKASPEPGGSVGGWAESAAVDELAGTMESLNLATTKAALQPYGRHNSSSSSSSGTMQQEAPGAMQSNADDATTAATAAKTLAAGLELMPAGLEERWMSGAVAAAQGTATRGVDLQQLCQALSQQASDKGWWAMQEPSSYIVRLPADCIASRHRTAAGDADCDQGVTPTGIGSTSSAAGRDSSSSSNGQDDHLPSEDDAGVPAGGHAASSSGGPLGTSGITTTTSTWPSQPRVHDAAYEHRLKVIGDVGERFVYELFANTLPGFDGSCWHSGSRHLIGLPQPSAEPPYDFLYTDTQGVLCGKPGTRCFIECKSTICSLSSSSEPKAIEISPAQWELARSLHLNPDQGVYVVARVDRVGQAEGPRLVSVLQDPVKLLVEGKLWVTADEKLLLKGYPVSTTTDP